MNPIDGDRFLYFLKEQKVKETGAFSKGLNKGLNIAISALKNKEITLPWEVDRVKHGNWNGEADGYADGELVYDVWYCSECNYCIDDGTDDPDLLPNYCPNCGARMKG